MQLYAIDKEGNRIHASIAQKGQSYRCPGCSGGVKKRGGSKRKEHFYHFVENEALRSKCRLSGKSEAHLQAQERLCRLTFAKMERPFPEVGRIADVCWEEEKIIFEVQCSSISKEEVRARNADYGKCGYLVVWIFHEKLRKFAFSFDGCHYFLSKEGNFYDTLPGSPPRLIDPSSPLPLPTKGWLRNRRRWPICFSGDFFSASVKEIRKARRFFAVGKVFALINAIKRPYRIFLRNMLENFGKVR